MTSETSIGIPFSIDSLGDVSYWLKLTQLDNLGNTATEEEVAELIDDMFGMTPCEDGKAQDEYNPDAELPEQEENDPVEANPSEARMQQFIWEKYNSVEDLMSDMSSHGFTSSGCGFNFGESFDGTFRVAKSHTGILYKLVTIGGVITAGPIIVNEDVDYTIVLENASSIDLDYLVLDSSDFSYEFVSSVYVDEKSVVKDSIRVVLNGSSLSFSESITATIRIQHSTTYDTYVVNIPIDKEQSELLLGESITSPCVILAFWGEPGKENTEVQVLDMELPKKDEEDEVTCISGATGTIVPKDKEDTEEGGKTEQGCINEKASWGLDGYNSQDQEAFNEICCVSGTPAQCLHWAVKYYGGAPVSLPTDNDISFTPVSPKRGYCGEIHYYIDVKALGCCDIDWGEPTFIVPEIITCNTDYYVSVTGGHPPYSWRAGGAGASITSIDEDGYVARLSFGDDCCGSYSVECTDSCGNSTTEAGRSTEGYWAGVTIEYGRCNVVSGTYTTNATSGCPGSPIVGSRYKATFAVYMQGYANPCPLCPYYSSPLPTECDCAIMYPEAVDCQMHYYGLTGSGCYYNASVGGYALSWAKNINIYEWKCA